jgi:hypothetical protein
MQKLTIESSAACECTLVFHAAYSAAWQEPQYVVSSAALGPASFVGRSQLGPIGRSLAMTRAI